MRPRALGASRVVLGHRLEGLMSGALFYFTRPESSIHFAGAAFLLAAILTAVSLIPFQRGVIANRGALPDDDGTTDP